jgi:hypothetical protein
MNPINFFFLELVNKTDTSVQPGPDSGIGTGSNKPKPKN